MSIQVALHHVTHYRYDRAVELGPQIVRLARFFRLGHTPGKLDVAVPTLNDELPMTLDLRRP